MWHGHCIKALCLCYMMLRCNATAYLRCLPYVRNPRCSCAYLTSTCHFNTKMWHSKQLKRPMVTPPSLTPNKRLTTLHQRDPVKANSDSIQMELDGMSTKFGKNSEFNRLMYNDDNVLMTLNVKLKNPKYKATIDVTMDHTTALCTYSVTLNGGKVRN